MGHLFYSPSPPTKSHKSTPRAYPSLTYNFRARCCPGLFGIPSVFHRLLFCKLADLYVSASAAKSVKWMIPTGSSSFVIRQRSVVSVRVSLWLTHLAASSWPHPLKPKYTHHRTRTSKATLDLLSQLSRPRLAFPAVAARVCPRPSSLKSRLISGQILRRHAAIRINLAPCKLGLFALLILVSPPHVCLAPPVGPISKAPCSRQCLATSGVAPRIHHGSFQHSAEIVIMTLMSFGCLRKAMESLHKV